MFVKPPDPSAEWLKLEEALDRVEPRFPPAAPSEKNPLDLDHFSLLDDIDELTEYAFPEIGFQVAVQHKLLRHYLNALRQMVAQERYDVKQKEVMALIKKKLASVEAKLVKLHDGKKQKTTSTS